MTMTREELRELGIAAYGPNWQTPLARERKINERTVRYWVARGIDKVDLAEDVRAFLRSRRIVTLPDASQIVDRDAAAVIIMDEMIRTLLDAGAAVGWEEVEMMTALFSVAVDRIVEGAGAAAAVEVLKEALAQTKARVSS